MQKEFWKKYPLSINFLSNINFFSSKNGCGPATPLSISEKIIIISDHKLLDAKWILKIYPTLVAFKATLIFAKKWVWPCHVPQGDPACLKKNMIFSYHKLPDAIGILIKIYNFSCLLKQLQFLPKNWCGPATPLRATQHAWENSENFNWLLATRFSNNFEK